MRLRTIAVRAPTIGLAVVATSVALLAGCGGSSATDQPATTAAHREAAASPRPRCFPNCEYEVLDGSPLEGADLRGGNFSRARWQGARLRGANLAGADLSGADFSPLRGWVGYWHGPDNPYSDDEGDAKASGDVPVTPSDLTDANLKGARLTGANLTDVIWNDTTCPNGTVTNTRC